MQLHCPKCKTTKPDTDFSTNPHRKTGYNSWCKVCLAAASKLSRSRKPEHYASYQREYRASHVETIRAQNVRSYWNNREKRLALNKEYYDPEKKHAWHIRREFGLTAQDYAQLLARQRGGCAICGAPPTGKKLAVDHCHKTGKIRGLLCGKHNKALGLFADDPALLLKAVVYLKDSSE